jgi:hypothetical protein
MCINRNTILAVMADKEEIDERGSQLYENSRTNFRLMMIVFALFLKLFI